MAWNQPEGATAAEPKMHGTNLDMAKHQCGSDADAGMLSNA